MSSRRMRSGTGLLWASSLFLLAAATSPRPTLAEDVAPAPPAAARTFATPEEAVNALVEACAKNDDAALLALVGPGNEDLVRQGADPVVAQGRRALAETARKGVGFDRTKPDAVVVEIGPDRWPLCFPLVPKDGRWSFDGKAGRAEFLARRIGQNELGAIERCRVYVDAQVEYASKDRDGDEVREYAQKLVSTPGQHDGLYWEADPAKGEEESPLAPVVTPLKEFLTGRAKGAPFGGYYWRILTAQGPHAPGGAYSYVVNGNMIAGFALVGVPAQYRVTGVMTFVVSNHGTIYQKDLGEKTLDVVKEMTTFDPDSSWKPVPEEDLAAASGG